MGVNREETLDPEDWSDVRTLAHKMVDDAVDHLSSLRDRPIWAEMPEDTQKRFLGKLPQTPSSLESVYDDFRSDVLAHSMGNTHPRFWGWYMGASNFTGALADFLAAVDGSNLGGGNTGAARVEEQVVDWMKEIVGFPESASGTLTSGGSMANAVALTVARNSLAGVDVRKKGVTQLQKPLRFYTSAEAHSCHQKGLEILGLGAEALCFVPTNADFSMNMDALEAAISKDKAAGFLPACVIATAGTTNSGAIDDLERAEAICRQNDMWFHIDGCIGALIRIAPENASLVSGLEAADSVALDPHKWLHTPFAAGCVLVKDESKHFNAFEMHGDYLQMQTRGLISGKFLADYGFDLSRGFVALKIWMSLKENGIEKFGRLIDQNIAQAKYLEQRLTAEPDMEVMVPAQINILCFRFRADLEDETELKALNTEIMLRMQEGGFAVVSDTTLGGRHCLRIAINNHRTTRADLDAVVDEVLKLGRELRKATPIKV